MNDTTDDSLRRAFASLLRSHIERKGILQRDFAESCGMPLSRLNEILSGKRNVPTLQRVAQLAHGMGITPGKLVDKVFKEAEKSNGL